MAKHALALILFGQRGSCSLKDLLNAGTKHALALIFGQRVLVR